MLRFLSVFTAQASLAAIQYNYTTEQRGQRFAEDNSFSLYFREGSGGDLVSPWHDIPLYYQGDPTNQTLNMIVEIPRFSQAKFEIHREQGLNPIKQDVKAGHLRYLPNLFPWHGHLCNYGAFPQTWENPFHQDPLTGLLGDRDPLDVCDVGSRVWPTGTVLPVRVLGILALLDSGETDWKVIVMNAREAEERGISHLEDLEDSFPGLQMAVQKFFRVYKVPTGDGENEFAYGGQIQDKVLAEQVIRFLHEEWRDMMGNCTLGTRGQGAGYYNTDNTKVLWSPCQIEQAQAQKEVDSQAAGVPEDAPVPPGLHSWSFLPGSGQDSQSSGHISPASCHPGLLCVVLLWLYMLYDN